MAINTQIHLFQPERNRRSLASGTESANPVVETLFPLRSNKNHCMVEKHLSRRSVLHLAGDHQGEEIDCLDGIIWITQSGNPEDFVVWAGQSFPIQQKGVVLVQGMAETRLRITISG